MKKKDWDRLAIVSFIIFCTTSTICFAISILRTPIELRGGVLSSLARYQEATEENRTQIERLQAQVYDLMPNEYYSRKYFPNKYDDLGTIDTIINPNHENFNEYRTP